MKHKQKVENQKLESFGYDAVSGYGLLMFHMSAVPSYSGLCILPMTACS
jgi:hypothetical protein